VEKVVASDTAGSTVDPNICWTNRSPANIADEVGQQGFNVGTDTVRRILTDDLGLSLRQAVKEEAGCHFLERDEQFQHIARLRTEYEARGWPVLSIDTKKKEILGNFFHPGCAYTNARVTVQDHDFVTSQQRLVPYGVFDTVHNEGLILLACGTDSSELACDGIWRWWQRLGGRYYWNAPCCCCATAAAATAIDSIVSKKTCRCWPGVSIATFEWPIIRRDARSTTRLNIACSAT
jgi:hypothetical protein